MDEAVASSLIGAPDGRFLSKTFAFGQKTDVAARFLDDTHVVYAAGRNVVVANVAANTQRFIPATDNCDAISCIAVSPNRRYIAVAESGPQPIVTLYDPNLKRRKLIQLPAGSSNSIVALAFSADSRYIATVTGSPQWQLSVWQWERGRALASVDVKSSLQSTVVEDRERVTCVSFCPRDPQILCVTGFATFAFYTLSDSGLTLAPGGANRRTPPYYTSHTWCSAPYDESVVATTDAGDLLYVNTSSASGFECLGSLSCAPQDGSRLTAIVATSRGLLVGGARGVIHAYDRLETAASAQRGLDSYRHVCSVRVDGGGGLAVERYDWSVVSLATASDDEQLLVLTSTNNLVSVPVASIDVGVPTNGSAGRGGDLALVEHSDGIAGPCHASGILAVSIATRRPIFATCAADRTVRLWDIVSHSVEEVASYPTDALSVAMHPSGLHMVVGFADRLRFMNILGTGVREARSFGVRGCTACAFSHGGHKFAAVHSNIVDLYDTNTVTRVAQLRAHEGKVRALAWSEDDTYLVSVGVDGGIVLWDLRTFQRADKSIKTAVQNAVVCDSKSLLVAGSDNVIREMDLTVGNGQLHVLSETPVPFTVTTMCLSSHNKVLYVGCDDGCVRALTFPIAASTPEVVAAHSGPVACLTLNHDASSLISCGEDGTVFLYAAAHSHSSRTHSNGRVRDGDTFAYADEVLIVRSDLASKDQTISELRQRLVQQQQQSDADLLEWRASAEQRMAGMEAKFKADTERLSGQLDALTSLKQEQELSFAEMRRDVLEKHRAELSRMKAEHETQRHYITQQMEQLKAELDSQKESADGLRATLLAEHERELARVRAQLEEKLVASNGEVALLQRQLRDAAVENDELRKQAEEDFETEIEQVRGQYDGQLASERDSFLHLKGENGIMRKKFHALQKENARCKDDLTAMNDARDAMVARIQTCERDLEALKNEVKDRDELIGEKEKRIYDLKKRNSELEKFRFVLNFKIKELRAQIEPKHDEVVHYKARLREMDAEINRYREANGALQLSLSDFKAKQQASARAHRQQQTQLRSAELFQEAVERDVEMALQQLQNPKQLKGAVRQLQSKYCGRNGAESVGRADSAGELGSARHEHLRQREYLERSVENLKKKLAKDNAAHKSDLGRIMTENVLLIQEVNTLRRDLRAVRATAPETAEQGAVVAATRGAPAKGRASSPSQPVGAVAEQRLAVAQREIDLQRAEIIRLRSKVTELERIIHAHQRPPTHDRLPPIGSITGVASP